MTISQVQEETTFRYTSQLVDETATNLTKASLEALTLEVYEQRGETRLRTARDAYDANDVTIASGGSILWLGQLEDTRIVNTSSRIGSPETHVALFQFAWDVSLFGTLTNPASATSGSNIVTITATAHGITDDANEDHVFLVADNTVGGLNLNGGWKVNSIVDVDTFTILHKCNATSTEATAGGTVKLWINPRIGIHTVNFSVIKVKPAC
jgi:hypothetical protein